MFPSLGGEERPPIALASVLTVPLLLAAIHLLVPQRLERSLVFSHDRFAIYTLFTAAYVHAGQTHLLGNVAGYLLTTVYAYTLCVAVDERRWFWRTFVLFLLALPVLVNLSSYVAFSTWYPSTSPISRGFSGVVAGFGGFLLVALVVYVRKRYSTQLGGVVGVSAFLVLLAIVDSIYSGRVRPVVAGLVAAGIVLQVGSLLQQVEVDLDELDRRRVVVDAGAVALVFVVLGSLVVAMFPADIVRNGRMTNIVAHAIGFLLGIAGSGLTKPGSVSEIRGLSLCARR